MFASDAEDNEFLYTVAMSYVMMLSVCVVASYVNRHIRYTYRGRTFNLETVLSRNKKKLLFMIMLNLINLGLMIWGVYTVWSEIEEHEIEEGLDKIYLFVFFF